MKMLKKVKIACCTRRMYYRTLCKVGIHNYTLLPTQHSTKDHVQYDACCGRCGKASRDLIVILLVGMLNRLKELK